MKPGDASALMQLKHHERAAQIKAKNATDQRVAEAHRAAAAVYRQACVRVEARGPQQEDPS